MRWKTHNQKSCLAIGLLIQNGNLYNQGTMKAWNVCVYSSISIASHHYHQWPKLIVKWVISIA